MAKLSARGATILWQVHKVVEPSDAVKAAGADTRYVTRFYALRSDGKFLNRISIRSWNRYSNKWQTDSGHWTIDRTVTTEQQRAEIKDLLIKRGYSES